jgi:hypothetical protein
MPADSPRPVYMEGGDSGFPTPGASCVCRRNIAERRHCACPPVQANQQVYKKAVRSRDEMDSADTHLSPISTPEVTEMRPTLEVRIPSYESTPISSSSSSPLESARSFLQQTINSLPDVVLSPAWWKLQAPGANPLILSYAVPDSGVVVQVTGYANGQYVVRIFSAPEGQRPESPLVAVSVLGHECFGEVKDVPAWKVRETLLERIGWSQMLD